MLCWCHCHLQRTILFFGFEFLTGQVFNNWAKYSKNAQNATWIHAAIFEFEFELLFSLYTKTKYVHNVCFKKTGTKRSSVLLLSFVLVFLKQTLGNKNLSILLIPISMSCLHNTHITKENSNILLRLAFIEKLMGSFHTYPLESWYVIWFIFTTFICDC